MFQAISTSGFPTKTLHAFLFFPSFSMSLAHLIFTKVGVSFQNSWIAIVLGNKSVSSASFIIRQTGYILQFRGTCTEIKFNKVISCLYPTVA